MAAATFQIDIRLVTAAAQRAAQGMAAGFTRITNAARSLGSRLVTLGRAVARLATSFRALIVTLAAFLALRAVATSFTRLADEMDNTAKSAARLGASTEFLSTLSAAAGFAGVDIAQLDAGFIELNKRMSMARDGNKEMSSQFRRLGVDFRQGLEPSVYAAADAVAGLTDAQDRAAAAAKFFGEGAGPQLVGLLSLGSAGIKALQADAERFGMKILSGPAAAAERFNDALARLTGTIRNIQRIIAGEQFDRFADIFNVAAAGLAEFTPMITQMIDGALDYILDKLGVITRFVVNTFLGTAEQSGEEVRKRLLESFLGIFTKLLSAAGGFFGALGVLMLSFAQAVGTAIEAAVLSALRSIEFTLRDTMSKSQESVAENLGNPLSGMNRVLSSLGIPGMEHQMQAASMRLHESAQVSRDAAMLIGEGGATFDQAAAQFAGASGSFSNSLGGMQNPFAEFGALLQEIAGADGHIDRLRFQMEETVAVVQPLPAQISELDKMLRALRNTMEQVGQGFVGAWTEIKKQINDVAGSTQSAVASVFGSMTSASDAFFESIITGTSAKDAFKQFISAMTKSLTGLAAQLMTIVLLALLLNVLLPGIGIATGGAATAVGGATGAGAGFGSMFAGGGAAGAAPAKMTSFGSNQIAQSASKGGDTYYYIEATDADSFARKFNSPQVKDAVRAIQSTPRMR